MLIRVATRGSALALAQTRQVCDLLGETEIVEVSSDGKQGDKARFVRGIEWALLREDAELGVHSAKDLPAGMHDDLLIASVPVREDPRDVWIGAGASLTEAPEGARVGTASLRRRAQLLAARPDLEIVELHGNVDTRLRRLSEDGLDAIVLAAAGLRRLGREDEAAFAIPVEQMTPAAGQGALVLQTRTADEATTAAAGALGDETALRELTAERATVAMLESSCTTPIGVHAKVEGGEIAVEAFVGLPDGSEWIRDRVEGDAGQSAEAGMLLGERLLSAGARDILDRADEWSWDASA